ncbi:MAG: hypothetical protein EBS64_10260 [Verrucomicrobia bacterium]|jgi:hypothetical protein|nr:hypothetical protein [Verrucomicrobiota bacterium]
MTITYRITSSLLIGDYAQLLATIFPAWNGEPVSASQSEITVTFATPQTPVDLGPLVRVEVIDTV